MNHRLLPTILSLLTYRLCPTSLMRTLKFLAESEPLSAANEIDDCTSESQSDSESLMTDSPPDPEPGSTATSTTTLGEPTQLPVVGPYDLGAIKSSLLGGRLSDDDKCKVLKQLDQPQQYKFPAVMEGQQLQRFQSSWFSKYPWLAYSRSENGGYCAYCLAWQIVNITQ